MLIPVGFPIGRANPKETYNPMQIWQNRQHASKPQRSVAIGLTAKDVEKAIVLENNAAELRIPHTIRPLIHRWRWPRHSPTHIPTTTAIPLGMPHQWRTPRRASHAPPSMRPLPMLPPTRRRIHWSHSRIRSVDLSPLSALVRAPATGDDGEDNEATDAGGDANDEGFVAVDPGFDFVGYGRAGALALIIVLVQICRT
jgi:hypothetical protein